MFLYNLAALPSVLRKYLEDYGLSSEISRQAEEKYKTVEGFMRARDSDIARTLNISVDKVRRVKEYLREKGSQNNLINDFLTRWGKVTSEEDLRKAYEEYERLGKLYPKSPAVWSIKGEILEKLSRMDEAKKAYEKAYSLHMERGEIPPPELEKKIRTLEKKKIVAKRIASTDAISSRGMINGFKNGLINGFKNGLINGTGLVNGIGRGAPPAERRGPWRFMVSLIIILLIILAPLMGTLLLEKKYMYRVDGKFEEWKTGIPYYGLERASGDINIRYVKFHPADNGIYFYIKTVSEMLKNSSGIYIFLDTDNSTSTGYLIRGIGADYMVEIYGWNSTLKGKTLYYFNSTDQHDFAGFHSMGSVSAILRGDNLEGFAKVPASHFRAIVVSYNYAFMEDIAPCLYYGRRNFIVEEYSGSSVLPLDKRAAVLKMPIRGGDIRIWSMKFLINGTADARDIKFSLYQDNGNGVLDSEDTLISASYILQGDTLSFDNLDLSVSNATLFLAVVPHGSSQKTLSVRIEEIGANIPYFLDYRIVQASYIGKISEVPHVDGSFADWRNAQQDSADDVITSGKVLAVDANIDLLRYSSYTGKSLLVYLMVKGRLLGGTDVPTLRFPTLPDSDRDTVPDKFDLYPNDFNNDGIPDNESSVMVNGVKYPDVDGDGVPDYPYGNDMWLNTTIPSNFPKPYAGRHVSVYIGPVPHRKVYGMDAIDIYINSDGDNRTGFSLPQYPFGADYKVEFIGKNGRVYESGLYEYSQGKWIPVGDVDYALGYHALEVNTTLPRGNVLITLSDWRENRDVSDKPILSMPSEREINVSTQMKLSLFGLTKPGNYTEREITPEFLGSYSSLSSVFGNDVKVSNLKNSDKRDELLPSMVRMDDGTLWVVFSFIRGNGKSDVAIAKSTDDGATWDAWKLYGSRLYDTFNPVITKDEENNLYIFFENHTSGAHFQVYKYYASTHTWMLYTYSNSSWWSDVYNISVASYSNYIYMAFEYHNISYGSTLGYLMTSDQGESWSGVIWDLGDWAGHPSVTISTGSNPRVFIAFELIQSSWLLTSVSTVVMANTQIGSSNWAQVASSESSLFLSYKYPSIFASGDFVYVAVNAILFGSTAIGVYIFNSTDNGYSWGSLSPAIATGNELYPWIVASGRDVYIFYLNTTTGYICMVESHDGGNTWSNAIVVSDEGSGVDIYRTVAAIYAGGKLYVVWTDNRNGNDDIYFDKVPEFSTLVLPLIFIAAMVLVRTRKRKQH